MSVATVLISVLLAALLAFSAIRKLTHEESVVEGYARAGVPEDKLNLLAFLLLAGAAGLIAGIAWAPIGIAAAIALVVYFAVAITFHIRADDAKNLPTPLVMEVLAVAALSLQLVGL